MRMTGDEDPTEEIDVDEKTKKLMEKAAEMGDRGTAIPPEGQICARCDRRAVVGPGEDWLCRMHQKEYFRERHG